MSYKKSNNIKRMVRVFNVKHIKSEWLVDSPYQPNQIAYILYGKIVAVNFINIYLFS